MSRKNKMILNKQQRLKTKRIRKINFRKMRRAKKNGTSDIVCNNNVVPDGPDQWTVVNINNKNNNTPIDERPTTSRNVNKHTSPNMKPKKSPRKNIAAGKKVYRFKKLKDDQTQRKLARRSVSLMKDNQTAKKFGQSNKVAKRSVNNNKSQTSRNGYKIQNKYSRKKVDTLSVNTLEEGEIRSEDETLLQIITHKSDDDDDCILVEPTVDEIVIHDGDDEDTDNDNNIEITDSEIPSTSIMSTSYQSLIKSFNQRTTSTPCNKNANNVNRQLQSTSYATVVGNTSANGNTSEEPQPFFEDVARWPYADTINSTDNFTEYTKLTTISDNFRISRRSFRLKENSSEEIIDLHDSNYSSSLTVKPINSTLKRKSCDLDDSVIFISETNKNDFIPLTDENNIPKNKVPKIQDKPYIPPNRVRLNNLYTKSETKLLTAYNANTYNPSAGQELMSGKRMVIIDGSNVAFKHSLDKNFSVKGLTIAINYFEKMGHEVKAVIPQFRMNKNKSSDYEELDRLHKAGKIVQTPCKNLPGLVSTSYDDRFILQLAFELDAAIVSNDNYRDLLHENPAFKKIIENCVIGYTWCNDIFILPKDPYGKWGPNLHTILNR